MLQESILQYIRPAFSHQLSFRPLFCLHLSGRLRQVLLYFTVTLVGHVQDCTGFHISYISRDCTHLQWETESTIVSCQYMKSLWRNTLLFCRKVKIHFYSHELLATSEWLCELKTLRFQYASIVKTLIFFNLKNRQNTQKSNFTLSVLHYILLVNQSVTLHRHKDAFVWGNILYAFLSAY